MKMFRSKNYLFGSLLVLVVIIFLLSNFQGMLDGNIAFKEHFSNEIYVSTEFATTVWTKQNTQSDQELTNLTGYGYTLEYQNIPYWIKDDAFSGIECISGDLRMTNRKYSKIILINVSNDTGVVTSKIIAYNGFNETKIVGGDLFLLWGEQVDGDGRIAGVVTDNMDGTYTGTLKPVWKGRTVIKAKLGGTIENACVRISAIKKYGNSVFALKIPPGIHATFINGVHKENTLCGTESEINGNKNMCNFTQVNDGLPWYCGRPANKNITCANLKSFTEIHFEKAKLLQHQNASELFQIFAHGEIDSKVSIKARLKSYTDQNIPCNKVPKKYSWTYSAPSGYFLKNTWQIAHCKHTISFNEEQYRTCLKNKTIALFGDSTIRQYADYFMKKIMLMKPMDLKTFRGDNKTYNPKIDFENFGFRFFYKKHEMPFHASTYSANGITSVAKEILALAQGSIPGKNIVILLTYCSHMQEFPPTRYSERMKGLVSAIKQLLKIKPEAKVFVKGPHIYYRTGRWFDLRITLIDKDIIFKEFQELRNKVTYLDVWSITLAHNSEAIHPDGNAFTSQIQQFMSYICSS